MKDFKEVKEESNAPSKATDKQGDVDAKDKITWFKYKQIILYPRKAFVEWFMRQTRNKKAEIHQLKPTATNKAKQDI